MPSSTPLRGQLLALRLRLRFRKVAGQILAACALQFLFFILQSLLEKQTGLREATALFWSALGAAVNLLFLIRRSLRCIQDTSSLEKLSVLVEAANPEFMDAYACAVELEGCNRPLNSLEQRLLEDMQRRIDTNPSLVADAFLPRGGFKVSLLLLALAASLLSFSGRTSACQKASYALKERLGLIPPGIAFLTSTREVPRQGDLSLEIHVRRWSDKADILLRSAEGVQRFPMNPSGFRRSSFTFYNVASPLRFRILTPDLSSPWQTLAVYDPPSWESVRITTTPPPYTGRAPIAMTDFGSLSIVEGEEVAIAVKTQPGNTGRFGDAVAALEADGMLHARLVPTTSGNLECLLRDSAGHQSSQSLQVEVLPDLPPVISLTAPEGDAQVRPQDSLRVMAIASDDFGLSSLRLLYSVNGGPRQAIPLRQHSQDAPWEKEWDASYMWDLPKMGTKTGDMLSCVVVAEDNRQPFPQSARSDLFFVVIRPDPESVEADGPSGPPPKKADLSDLIAEAKRLLRLNWDAQAATDSLPRMKQELTSGLSQLTQAIQKRSVELEKMTGLPLMPPISTWFQQAAEANGRANSLAQRDLFQEALPYQEQSLAALVSIETELIKNSLKSKKAQEGKEKGDSESEPDDKQQAQDQESKGQGKPNLKELKALQESVQDLLQKQEKLNGAIARQDSQLSPLASRQSQIQKDTEGVAEKTARHQDLKTVASILQGAAAEMDQGALALQNQQRQTGGIHGTRARMQLATAERLLDEAVKGAAANELKQLSNRAAQLSDAQKEQAEASANAAGKPQGKEEAQAAKERQNQLNQQTDDLMKNAREAAANLERQFPQAAKALNTALSKAEKDGLRQSQARAKNALLYKRFQKAAQEQTVAANRLMELANSFSEAASQMPALNEQQLRDALEDLERLQSEINSAMNDKDQQNSSQRIQNARQKAAQKLQDLADATQSPELQQLSNDLSMPTGEATPSQAGSVSINTIHQATRQLNRLLDNLLQKRTKQLLKQNAPPPERYRRQVEEYFQNINN